MCWMSFRSPPGNPMNLPLIAGVPEPSTSSHQARPCGSLCTVIFHRPLKSASVGLPAGSAAVVSKSSRTKVRMMIVCGSIYHTARFSPNLRHMVDMHRLLVAVLCCGAAHAAQIGGVVLDAATGRPLARSLVTLRPVQGTDGKALSTRANREGQFFFPPKNE